MCHIAMITLKLLYILVLNFNLAALALDCMTITLFLFAKHIFNLY